MGERPLRPAFYAAGPGGWRDWWTLLHPPYTAWHLSYVVIGASLAPHVDTGRLVATLLAFFAAVGLGAHALDELHGRPLRTQIPTAALVATMAVGLLTAVVLGVIGIERVGAGRLSRSSSPDRSSSSPTTPRCSAGSCTPRPGSPWPGARSPCSPPTWRRRGRWPAPVLAAVGAFALSATHRRLSTPARNIRRRAQRVEGSITFGDGRTEPVTADTLLQPLERALRAASWAIILLAAALAVARLA